MLPGVAMRWQTIACKELHFHKPYIFLAHPSSDSIFLLTGAGNHLHVAIIHRRCVKKMFKRYCLSLVHDRVAIVGIEIIERIVRVTAILVFLVLAWMCLGGETLLVAPTPISNFLVHLVMFFFLGSVSYVGWVEAASRVAVVMVVLAVVFEVAQVVLPGRTFAMLDLAGNLIGVGLAWAFFRVLLNFKRTIRA